MSGLVTLNGQAHLLRLLVGQARSEPLVIRRFGNDHQPSMADLRSDYQEIEDRSYKVRSLAGLMWTPRDGGGISYPEQVYAFTEHQDVYGYWLELERTGEVVAAERFRGAPFRVNPSDQIRITPQVS